jgi:transposase InsO family protein
MCAAFNVSRSHYYDYRHGAPGPRAKEEKLLQEEIETIFDSTKSCYGSPRITEELRKQGWSCGRKRVARIMQKQGLKARIPRRYHRGTTDSNHEHAIAPNRLAQIDKVEHVNQVWTSDITYIQVADCWNYLAVTMDLFSRNIIGWSLRDHLRTELPMEALQKALSFRDPKPGMLHHSDQGVQYASYKYQKLLAEHKIVPSMSRRGNCYDNAAMESFFGSLKNELEAPRGFQSYEHAKASLFEYIEVFYNRKRLHSSLGYKSPLEFEASFT